MSPTCPETREKTIAKSRDPVAQLRIILNEFYNILAECEYTYLAIDLQ